MRRSPPQTKIEQNLLGIVNCKKCAAGGIFIKSVLRIAVMGATVDNFIKCIVRIVMGRSLPQAKI